MAFFGGDDPEVAKLKKLIGQKDLTLSNVESERNSLVAQLAEAKSRAHEALAKLAHEEERSLNLDRALAKTKSDLEASLLKSTNLASVLEAAKAREAEALKRDKLSEREKERFDYGRNLEVEQERKVLEDRVKSLERQVQEKDEELRNSQYWPVQGSRARSGTRGVDPAAKLLALENQLLTLEFENEKLRKATSELPVLPPARAPMASPAGKLPRGRRPRSSSVTGASSLGVGSSSDLHSIRVAGELESLRTTLAEVQSELEVATGKWQKAEKDKMKAENEAIAAERTGKKRVDEVKEELVECKMELKWRIEELQDLHKEKDLLKEEFETVQMLHTRQNSSHSAGAAEMKDLLSKVAALEQQLDDKEKQLERASAYLLTAQDRNSDLQAQVARSEPQPAESAAESAMTLNTQPPSLFTSSSSSSLNTFAGASNDRAIRDLKRQLASRERELEALQESLKESEDALEKAQAQLEARVNSDVDAEGVQGLVSSNELDGLREQVARMQAESQHLQHMLDTAERERDAARTELVQLRSASENTSVNKDELEQLESQVQELMTEREQVRSQLREANREIAMLKDEFGVEVGDNGTVANAVASEEDAEGTDTLKAQLATLSEHISAAVEERDAAIIAKGALEAELTAIKSTCESHVSELQTLTNSIASLQEDLQHQKAEASEAMTMANEKLEQQHILLKAVNEEKDRLLDAIDHYESVVRAKDDEVDRLGQALKVYDAEAAARGSDDAVTREKLHEEIERRDNQIADLLQTLWKREDMMKVSKRKLHTLADALSTTMVFGTDSDWSIYMGGQSVVDISVSDTLRPDDSVEREFEENLLDEIDNIRNTFDHLERMVELQRAEMELKIKSLDAELQEQKEVATRLRQDVANVIATNESAQAQALDAQNTSDLNRRASKALHLFRDLQAKQAQLVDVESKQRAVAEVKSEMHKTKQLQNAVHRHATQQSDTHTAWKQLLSDVPCLSDHIDSLLVPTGAGAEEKHFLTRIRELEAKLLRRVEQIGLEQFKLRQVEAELHRVKTQLELSQNDAQENDEDLKAAQSDIVDLQQRLASSGHDAQEQIESLNVQLEEREKAVAAIRLQYEQTLTNVSQLTETLESAQACIQDLQAGKEAAEGELQHRVGAHVEIEAKLTSLREKEQQLQFSLTRSEESITALQSQLDALSQSKEQLLAENGSLQMAKEAAEADAKVALESLVLAQQDATAAQRALEEVKASSEAVRQHHAEASSTQEELKTQLDSMRASQMAAEAAREAAETAQQVAQLQLSDAEARLLHLEQAHSEEKLKLSKSIERLEAEVRALGELQDKIASLQAEQESAPQRINDIVGQAVAEAISAEAEKRKEAAAELSSVQAALVTAQAEHLQLRSFVTTRENELADLKFRLQESDEKYWNTKEELATLQEREEQLQEGQQDLERLRKELGGHERLITDQLIMREVLEKELGQAEADLLSAKEALEGAGTERAKLASERDELASHLKEEQAQKADILERISILEAELEEKANEIEENDTQVFELKRDNKKLMSKVRLQDERIRQLIASSTSASGSHAGGSTSIASAKIRSGEVTSSVAPVTGRKRSNPDEAQNSHQAETNGEPTVRAVYMPKSPSKNTATHRKQGSSSGSSSAARVERKHRPMETSQPATLGRTASAGVEVQVSCASSPVKGNKDPFTAPAPTTINTAAALSAKNPNATTISATNSLVACEKQDAVTMRTPEMDRSLRSGAQSAIAASGKSPYEVQTTLSLAASAGTHALRARLAMARGTGRG
ncbi:hypothetical protein K437DRAFT_255211 [Tilletiaria anomala UBC 951]|uniref:Uncharacterized protein n=1 Tax=Tilletiaria anomala (strain ATCC 24038 / CBS 436.72 / UBC 951) TaxID=1037660 RepID=A0A066WFV3_TILAU|nr:uncharacterized protein K437DRAFT_255211 [Tilletiaria anomala UBC 951]KDN49949.1 hypothetical protein K437DRAFT_255211 [Tilletiaria anomala UBC 951]